MAIETYQKIICSNNIPALMEMEDNSVDSIVTDAPYGLGEEPDPIEVMKDWVEGAMGKNGKYGNYALDVHGANAGGLGDEGGASRFFYVAKPDVKERERGLRHFEFKDPASVTDFRPTLKSNPENWANGTETPYNRTTQRKNIHPTVKPVSLMRYLVKMVTPKGGICLDPYNGSGTTGMACKIEQINYIGIEQDEYSCKVSEARIASVEPEKIQQTLNII